MAKQRPKNSSPESASHTARTQIIVAIIGLAGVIIPAFLIYLQNQAQLTVPLNATQTTEAKIAALTAVANATVVGQITVTPIAATSIPTVLSTQSTSPLPSVTSVTIPSTTPPPASTTTGLTPIVSTIAPVTPQPTTVYEDWQSFLQVENWGQCPIYQAIPDYISLKNEYNTVMNQIQADSSGKNWIEREMPGIPYLRITSISQDKEWVVLGSKVTVSITVKEPLEHANILTQGESCGGAGDTRDFSIPLKTGVTSYDVSIKYPDADFFTLQPGEPEFFVFIVDECKGPGTYIINVSIPYSYMHKKGNISWNFPYEVVCPISYDSWRINSHIEENISGTSTPATIEYEGKYIWDSNKSKYILSQ